jgi:hypothetical protein
MQKLFLCAMALALSTTLAAAADTAPMGKDDNAMGGTTSMDAMAPKGTDDSMKSDDKMAPDAGMKADDKMGTDGNMKADDKMGK